MRVFMKGQFRFWIEAVGATTEVLFINRLFELYACADDSSQAITAFSAILCNGAPSTPAKKIDGECAFAVSVDLGLEDETRNSSGWVRGGR